MGTFLQGSVFVTESSQDGKGWPLLANRGFCASAQTQGVIIRRYNPFMARGWESKSIEAQQDEAAAKTTSGKPRLTREATARLREEENLRLSLRSVLQHLERTQDARHRTLLERAVADLEHRLRAIRLAGGGESPGSADV